MYNFVLFFLLISTPVLFEGRYRPVETLPQGAQYSVLEVDDYNSVAGTVYLKAEGKSLTFPTVWQLRAELVLFYIPFKWLLIGCYFLAACCVLWKPKFGIIFAAIGFTLHTIALALRCYVLERAPVSNMTETILYVPWIALAIGFVFRKEKKMLFAASTAAFILLLFLPQRPGLENVQPVLDSQYWLIVHVLMVVGSYGIFCIAGVCGHIFLLHKNPALKFEKILLQTMYLGCGLLICGTILGGVWAAESWGRFWDWDPKEAWAFISSGVYLIWIHAYRFKKIGGQGLAIGSIVGLMFITFTWYGVNYILGSGLHSYGFGQGKDFLYYFFLAAEVIFLASIFSKNKIYKKTGSGR